MFFAEKLPVKLDMLTYGPYEPQERLGNID